MARRRRIGTIVQIDDGGLRTRLKTLQQQRAKDGALKDLLGSLQHHFHGASLEVGGLQRPAPLWSAASPLAADEPRPGRLGRDD